MPIIREWVRIVPAQLNFLGPTFLVQFRVKNWTMNVMEDGMGVKVSAGQDYQTHHLLLL